MTIPKPILTRPERAIPETVPEEAIKVTRGMRNNNPFNLRVTTDKWDGKVAGQDPEFETFSKPFYGIRAAVKNTLTHYGRGENTVQKLISKHAPDNENPTEGFIKFVSDRMGVKPKEKIDLKDSGKMRQYVDAVIEFENSGYQYGDKLIDEVMEHVYGF